MFHPIHGAASYLTNFRNIIFQLSRLRNTPLLKLSGYTFISDESKQMKRNINNFQVAVE